jgi:hypothetical protein
MRRRSVILLAGALACGVLATIAIAATSDGRSPVTLAHADFFQDYQLSSDASGTATVLWSAQKFVHGMAGSALARILR